MSINTNDIESSDRVSEDAPPYGVLPPNGVRTSLAPDGLPWPGGYFDKKPRITLEKAIQKNGVRPHHYYCGWPVYTQAERDNSNYIFPYPDESEWVAELEAEADRRNQVPPE